jgi:hypothetical protein
MWMNAESGRGVCAIREIPRGIESTLSMGTKGTKEIEVTIGRIIIYFAY